VLFMAEDLERAVRLGMECRRVKEQKRRIGGAEFGNSHFSHVLGEDEGEQLIAMPEQGGAGIDGDPLPPGQVWATGPGR
jgi:ATP-dependent Lon protease